MPMPFVTPEVIYSIHNQGSREPQPDGTLYCHDVLREMTEENPHLAEAITATINLMTDKFELNPEDPKDANFIVNIANLSMSVYASIKQQMVCDELNG